MAHIKSPPFLQTQNKILSEAQSNLNKPELSIMAMKATDKGLADSWKQELE